MRGVGSLCSVRPVQGVRRRGSFVGGFCVGAGRDVAVFILGVVVVPCAALLTVHGFRLAGLDVLRRAEDACFPVNGFVLGDDLRRLAGFRAGNLDAMQVKKMVEIPVGSKVAFFCVSPFDGVDVVGKAASGGNADPETDVAKMREIRRTYRAVKNRQG